MKPQQGDPILSIRGLKMHFKSGFGKNKLVVKAIDGINFDIYKGEVFGLVGESGCGKTTTGRTIIKLHEPTDGEIFFMGKRIAAGTMTQRDNMKNIKSESKAEIKKIKSEISEIVTKGKQNQTSTSDIDNLKKPLLAKIADIRNAKAKALKVEKTESDQRIKDTVKIDQGLMRNMQMIFQDPIASLNPRMTVKEIISEGLIISGEKNQKVILKKVNEVLETVGLVPEHASRYPHEFSGGQRQRIGIARALIVAPAFIIADEPISALDVSIQAQVINLLNDLRENFGITIMFIAHDLSVIKYFSDRIGVMYYGNLVELTTAEELFKNPLHPYTKSLLSAVPLPDPRYEKKRVRVKYDPRSHDYSVDKPSMHEIVPGHFILCNEAELVEYKKEMK
ncbi:MAG: ATP-binding cassette domain-containing protein [Candidatus Izemoplasma sp.]